MHPLPKGFLSTDIVESRVSIIRITTLIWGKYPPYGSFLKYGTQNKVSEIFGNSHVGKGPFGLSGLHRRDSEAQLLGLGFRVWGPTERIMGLSN